MKIVMSRKGVDSTSGGIPSPILPDGRLRSLPIPQSDDLSSIRYSQIYANDAYPTGKIVESLTSGRVAADSLAHFDPDVDINALESRHSDWCGILGQSGVAQSHLENQGVGPGDLLLFFGLFRQTEGDAKKLKFVKGSSEIHTIWGYLQVAETVRIDKETAQRHPMFATHPHIEFPEQEANNTIYIARKTLKINGITKPLPGCGIFPTFNSAIQLTAPEARNPSTWCLPSFFNKRLSYHPNERWSPCDGDKSWVMLDAVGRGQEFVADFGNDTTAVVKWLNGLFDCAKP